MDESKYMHKLKTINDEVELTMYLLKNVKTWEETKNLFSKMLLLQVKLKKWLENLDKIDDQVEFNQWELRSILKDFLIDELKEDLNQ